jgi:hypothetical protein
LFDLNPTRRGLCFPKPAPVHSERQSEIGQFAAQEPNRVEIAMWAYETGRINN